MPLNTPARICTHTHHPTPPPPASVPWHPDVSVLLPFSRLQLAPSQLFSPACPPALGTRLIKDEEGPGVGWPGAMRTQPLGPSPPPELPDTCVMSVITGDPPGRPRLAPATQAVNKAGDGVRGTRGCGGGGGASLLPSRKAQLWISGAAETASRLPTDSQTSGSSPSSAQVETKEGKHSLSTYCMPMWHQELVLPLPTLDTAASVHLIAYCLSPPFEYKTWRTFIEHVLCTLC